MANKDRPVEPAHLDLGTLALFTGYALSDAVLAELHAGGHAALRFSHGFVFQHLIDGDRTVGELAERMELTQQAASKSVLELEELGYVERAADPDDARVRRVRLTKEGRAAVDAGRAARTRVVERLAAKVGAPRLEATRRTLVDVLQLFSTADDVRTRRVRAPR